MSNQDKTPEVSNPPRGAPAPAVPPEVEASALMRGQREVTILHAGARYRLRVTAGDKLILTK